MPPQSRQGQKDPSTLEGKPVVHTVVAAPPSSAETPPEKQDAAMRAFDGEVFVASSREDALLFHVEYGAVPLHPERWPWPGVAGVPLVPDAGEFCPEPDSCFPYGLAPGMTAAACVHTGGQTHTFGAGA